MSHRTGCAIYKHCTMHSQEAHWMCQAPYKWRHADLASMPKYMQTQHQEGLYQPVLRDGLYDWHMSSWKLKPALAHVLVWSIQLAYNTYVLQCAISWPAEGGHGLFICCFHHVFRLAISTDLHHLYERNELHFVVWPPPRKKTGSVRWLSLNQIPHQLTAMLYVSDLGWKGVCKRTYL